MLKLSKKGVSMSYKVTGTGVADGVVLSGCGKGQAGEIDIAGSSLVFTPVSDPWVFEMTKDGSSIGRAERSEASKHFVVGHGDEVVELDCQSVGNKPYEATVDGQSVGSISLSKLTGRVVTIDMPDTIPLETRLFAGWLALRTWNTGAEVRIRPT